MRNVVRLVLVCIVAGVFALPQRAAYAKTELGYLWSLGFNFENDYNAVLTIEVGPWVNGDLAAVDESSTERVRCWPVGAVALDNGDAVFSGGHIECEIDLAAVVLKNHGLRVDRIDNYGSIVLYTTAAATSQNIAPIFSHPDASYHIDFSRAVGVTLAQDLDNGLALQKAYFPNVTGAGRVDYSLMYSCVWQGDCHGSFSADGQSVNTALGGSRVNFRTTPTIVRIGGDGTSTFQGRMDSLLIDPGNSVH
ncbi:hypothetical protein HC891_28030 [Candidatus Gracilibacteria bacterium]|nr:hypothetical protein [Candidatus Gracilibacteria bacterium]